MSLDRILARLKGVRRSPQGWMAQCPAHGDRNPSLSIREDEGKILLHCFAGCTVETICGAVGIRVSDLFIQSRAFQKREPPIVRAVERELAGFRNRLTPRDRDRAVTVVLASREAIDAAIARALALTVEGELVQVALRGGQR
jgi:hypothetical protein